MKKDRSAGIETCCEMPTTRKAYSDLAIFFLTDQRKHLSQKKKRKGERGSMGKKRREPGISVGRKPLFCSKKSSELGGGGGPEAEKKRGIKFLLYQKKGRRNISVFMDDTLELEEDTFRSKGSEERRYGEFHHLLASMEGPIGR